MARPIPLEAPVTRAARSGIGWRPFGHGPAIQSGMQTQFAVMAVLLVVLLAIAAVTGGEAEAPAQPARASVAVIAHRVEALRGLRYTSVPKPVPVSAQTA